MWSCRLLYNVMVLQIQFDCGSFLQLCSRSCLTHQYLHQVCNCRGGVVQMGEGCSKQVLEEADVVHGAPHYRKRGLCRAFKFLPCVFYRAHDKELLCRASYKMHGNESLPCVLFYGARQRIFAVRFKYRRTAKSFFLPPLFATNGR
jgi:hypothetical protein